MTQMKLQFRADGQNRHLAAAASRRTRDCVSAQGRPGMVVDVAGAVFSTLIFTRQPAEVRGNPAIWRCEIHGITHVSTQ